MNENGGAFFGLYGDYAGFKQSGSSDPTTNYAEMSVDVTGAYSVREYYAGYVDGTFGDINGTNVEAGGNKAIYDAERGIVVFIKGSGDITKDSTIWVLKKGATASTANVSFKLLHTSSSNDLRLISFVDGEDTINIVIDGELTSSLSNLNSTITNNAMFNTSGTLNKTIAGTGTTKLTANTIFTPDASIAGTLNINNQAIDLVDQGQQLQVSLNQLVMTKHQHPIFHTFCWD